MYYKIYVLENVRKYNMTQMPNLNITLLLMYVVMWLRDQRQGTKKVVEFLKDNIGTVKIVYDNCIVKLGD